MEWIYWITAGLIFDIIGAGLVVSPILTLRKGIVHPRYYEEDMMKQKRFAWIGIGCLILGFTLQIIGNWFQYLK